MIIYEVFSSIIWIALFLLTTKVIKWNSYCSHLYCNCSLVSNIHKITFNCFVFGFVTIITFSATYDFEHNILDFMNIASIEIEYWFYCINFSNITIMFEYWIIHWTLYWVTTKSDWKKCRNNAENILSNSSVEIWQEFLKIEITW